MKKPVAWIVILSLLLLLAACGTATDEETPTDFLVSCFGCMQEFASGQLNADFGLCPDCVMRVGAAYCQNCAAPCYTRDMIQGLCKTCSALIQDAASIQESTSAQETLTEPEAVVCEYCGYSVFSDYMIGDYCIGCYSIREGKCLRCVHSSHLSDGCHCEHCSENWFYCANCDKHTAGNEMFLDLCLDCYWRLNSVLVPCPLCGRSIPPSEVKGGYCSSCYAQAHYEDTVPTEEPITFNCTSCGREYKTADDLYQGKCWSCYNEDKGLCVSCQKQPSDGLGPSGMECASCYYQDYATCPGCGYDYWKGDMYGGYCNSCGGDPLSGTYSAYYENVRITLSYVDYEYHLTYTDLSSGITLSNIPLSYYNCNTSTEKILMFIIDDLYSEYSGYVEFYLCIGARAEYSYNALIEGLEDSGGCYSPLAKD